MTQLTHSEQLSLYGFTKRQGELVFWAVGGVEAFAETAEPGEELNPSFMPRWENDRLIFFSDAVAEAENTELLYQIEDRTLDAGDDWADRTKQATGDKVRAVLGRPSGDWIKGKRLR